MKLASNRAGIPSGKCFFDFLCNLFLINLKLITVTYFSVTNSNMGDTSKKSRYIKDDEFDDEDEETEGLVAQYHNSEMFFNLLREYEIKHSLGYSAVEAFMTEHYFLQDEKPKGLWQSFISSFRSQNYLTQPYRLPTLSDVPLSYVEDDDNLVAEVKHFPLTFLPDFIIEELIDDSDAFFGMPLLFDSQAVVVIADVSGFTHLTELYSHKELSGADALAADLNKFMSNLASTLMLFGGDIIRFAGDAYLVQWEGKKESDLMELCEQAYNCAVYIQSMPSLDSCRLLQVKVGISLGKTKQLIMGSPSEFLLFAVTGPALLSVRTAEESCGPGDIIVSEDAYQCLKARECNLYHTTFLQQGFVKINGIVPNKDAEPLHFKGRSHLFNQCNNQRISLSRAFLIPILRDVKTKDQFNYLSEVSKITILFILVPQVDVVHPEFLDSAYQKILAGVKEFGGIMNKVVLFDKGCTFLAIFGLPGVKHLNDAARAVMSADVIRKTMKMDGLSTNIGISTGTCFCGIVGHSHRQEYTVIGWRVNMACRLMATYPDYSIVLDASTFQLCKQEIGEECFFELEKRKLKGIDNVPTIYCFKKQEREEEYDALSSFECMDTFSLQEEKYERIQNVLKSLRSKEKIAAVQRQKLFPVIAIQGMGGSGKSFLLYYATDIAISLNYQVLSCSALPTAVIEPFGTIARTLRYFFNILARKMPSRESTVLRFCTDKSDPYLFLLNHLLGVKFIVPTDLIVQAPVIHFETKRLLEMLIKSITSYEEDSVLLIAIDDAKHVDAASWKLLKHLAKTQPVVIVLSFLDNFKPPCSDAAIIRFKAYHKVYLESFTEDLLVPMICWYLQVLGVHKEIKSLLQFHALGDSQLLEELLICPMVTNIIKIRNINELSSDELASNFLMCNQLVVQGSMAKNKELMVCDIRKGIQFHKMSTSFKFQDAVKERLNNLSIQNRVVLKRAAVIGYSFYQHILEAVSYDISQQDLRSSIKTLIEQNILCMTSGMSDTNISAATTRKHPILIRAQTIYGVVSSKVKPIEKPKKVKASLQKLRFSTLAFRSCVLECMTKEQRINMHIEVAQNLELEGLTCVYCRKATHDFKRRESHFCIPVQTSVMNRCLQIPPVDLRECTCLTYRTETYCLISFIHADIGRFLNPVHYLCKAAESANFSGSAVQGLNYTEYAMQCFPSPDALEHYKPDRDERDMIPEVLKAALLKVRAEAFYMLNNVYDAANCAIQALDVLDLSILSFLGADPRRDTAFIFKMYSTPYIYEIAACLYVLARVYDKVKIYDSAYNLAKNHLYLINRCETDYFERIRAQTLFYEYKAKKKPFANNQELENSVLHMIHEQLIFAVAPLNILEIRATASAYIAMIINNLNHGELLIADTICAEVYRILKCVEDNHDMPLVLALAVQVCLHRKTFSCLLMYLNNLRHISLEIGNKIFLGLFYCAVADLELLKGDKTCFHDKLLECDIYLEMTGDAYPPDLAYFVAAKMALWMLAYKPMGDEDKAVNTFLRWYLLTVSLRTKDIKTYWGIAGELNYLRIRIIVDFRLLDHSIEEKKMKFHAIEEHLRDLRVIVKANFPVFEILWGDLTADVVMVRSNLRHKNVTMIDRLFKNTGRK